MFYKLIEHSIGIRAGAIAVVSLPKCDPRPCLRWIDLNRLMLLHTFDGSNYAFWKIRIRAFLCSIDDSVWDAVEIGWTRFANYCFYRDLTSIIAFILSRFASISR